MEKEPETKMKPIRNTELPLMGLTWNTPGPDTVTLDLEITWQDDETLAKRKKLIDEWNAWRKQNIGQLETTKSIPPSIEEVEDKEEHLNRTQTPTEELATDKGIWIKYTKDQIPNLPIFSL